MGDLNEEEPDNILDVSKGMRKGFRIDIPMFRDPSDLGKRTCKEQVHIIFWLVTSNAFLFNMPGHI